MMLLVSLLKMKKTTPVLLVPDVDSDRDVDGIDGIAVSWTALIASFVVV